MEPGAKESEEEFISRCIPYMVGEGMDQDQAAAVCYSKWESRQEFESYDDYPEAAKENAKVALRWAEENGWGDCGTPVGKIRAQQLAQGKPLSVETISRMHSYLSRAEEYYNESDTEACGTISYLLWGGLAGKRWAESKLKELGKI